jgi:hypothetical protein
MILSSEFWCVPKLFLFFFTFSLFSLFNLQEEREQTKKQKKKISKIQLSFGDYTSSTVGKIPMKRIQQHQKKVTNDD